MTFIERSRVENAVAILKGLKATLRRDEDLRVKGIVTTALTELKRALPDEEDVDAVQPAAADDADHHPGGDLGRRESVLAVDCGSREMVRGFDFVLDTLRRS